MMIFVNSFENSVSIEPLPYRYREDGSPVFADSLPIKPDLHLPSALEGNLRLSEYPGVAFRLVLALLDPSHRYTLVSLTIDAPHGVTTSDLHKFSLPKLLHALASADPFVSIGASRSDATDRRAQSTDDGWKAWRARADVEAKTSGPSMETLSWVARVYSWYRVVGGNPAVAVHETLGIPQRTASRWIAKARDAGLLD